MTHAIRAPLAESHCTVVTSVEAMSMPDVLAFLG